MKGKGPFKFSLTIAVLIVVILLIAAAISLLFGSLPALREFGWKFFFSKDWDPVSDKFGALPFLVGTLLTSFLALIISLPQKKRPSPGVDVIEKIGVNPFL